MPRAASVAASRAAAASSSAKVRALDDLRPRALGQHARHVRHQVGAEAAVLGAVKVQHGAHRAFCHGGLLGGVPA
ncbi:hypothetical protein AB0K48_22875 [Nonomuraea sp. NPDC055795]